MRVSLWEKASEEEEMVEAQWWRKTRKGQGREFKNIWETDELEKEKDGQLAREMKEHTTEGIWIGKRVNEKQRDRIQFPIKQRIYLQDNDTLWLSESKQKLPCLRSDHNMAFPER